MKACENIEIIKQAFSIIKMIMLFKKVQCICKVLFLMELLMRITLK